MKTKLQTFLVGGAVRDKLLGFEVTERDWVVVGATSEQLLGGGYKPVGKGFPVYLHPQTHEEYALARTERKTGPGYKGFAVQFSPTVTLEEDLLRRDLTVNAMAQDAEGHIIDPFNGRRDLELRLLRHVSPAFSEDPVRILRVARFAARYAHVGFRVAEETMQLMKHMVSCGEVNALVAERVWAEFVRAMSEKSPSVFINVLRQCGAAAELFPEIERMFGVPALSMDGMDIDVGELALECLEYSARTDSGLLERFALLIGGLGKPLTPQENWPQHLNHQQFALAELAALCERLRVPREYRKMGSIFIRFHELCHQAFELTGREIVEILRELGALKKGADMDSFLAACNTYYLVSFHSNDMCFPQFGFLENCKQVVLSVNVRMLVGQELQGAEIGEALCRLQIEAVDDLIARLGSQSK